MSNYLLLCSMSDNDNALPTFTVTDDPVGLGWKVTAAWAGGRTETITGFGSPDQARQWVREDSDRWLKDIPRAVQVVNGSNGSDWTSRIRAQGHAARLGPGSR